METTERADQLVNIIGDLHAMAQDALDDSEPVLASHLRQAADAALMRLAASDRELAEGWAEVYRCNAADRLLVSEELCALAASRLFNQRTQAMFAMAAGMMRR